MSRRARTSTLRSAARTRANLWQAAAHGLTDRLKRLLEDDPSPGRDEISNAFWCACHGGQRATAERLLERGADIDWIGHDVLTPLDAAVHASLMDEDRERTVGHVPG